MPQNMMTVPELATPNRRLSPGGAATILLGDTPDVFVRDVAPQIMMLPFSGQPSASESAASCGVATILLGDTPMKENFIREDMPQNMQVTLPEPAPHTERTAPG